MKSTLITGSSSGLGDGLTRYLVSKNTFVGGISRSENEHVKHSELYRHFSIDLGNESEVREKLPGVLKLYTSGMDLLVLNAGVMSEPADMSETSLEEMKSVMDINLWANKLILDAVIRSEIPVKQVVAISSGAAIKGNRGWNAYAISKAALNMLIQLYAKEMPDTHLSALAPGLVDTAMQAYIASLPEDERFPGFNRLRKARGTSEMPKPLELAPRLVNAAQDLYDKYPSGSFADIREMDQV
ncbi:MAG: SDR family NAD(P)-dependent oxidoreductase [Bacteroidales bacterium]